jgi:hypothetical protein
MVLSVAGACASAGRAVPATDQSISSGLALGDTPESAGDVWVDNRSSVPITVLSVTLHGCVNIQQACEVRMPVSVRVEQNTREIVFNVVRKVRYEPYRLTFYTEWRADTASKPAPATR